MSSAEWSGDAGWDVVICVEMAFEHPRRGRVFSLPAIASRATDTDIANVELKYHSLYLLTALQYTDAKTFDVN